MSPSGWWDAGHLFERFTQQARDVIMDADGQAKALGHEQVGPEHFVLGLLASSFSRAGEMLRGRGVSEDEFRARLLERVGAGDSQGLTCGPLLFTPRAKRVLELSLREALALGTNEIATEHMLLAITDEQEHFANALLLEGWGLGPEEIRGAIIESLPSLELIPTSRGVAVPQMFNQWQPGAVMFDRLNPAARHTISLAQEEARGLGHHYVGSEHLLLAMVHDRDEIADRVLRSAGLTSERVRDQIVRIVSTGEQPPSGNIPFTPRARKVLEFAHSEALNRGRNIIGTEYLLLGLLHENEGVGIRILREAGLDLQQIQTTVRKELPGPDVDPPRTSVKPEKRVQVSPPPRGFGLTVTPSEHAERVLMQACARALAEGRTEFNLQDVVFALRQDPDAAQDMANVVRISPAENPDDRGAASGAPESHPDP